MIRESERTQKVSDLRFKIDHEIQAELNSILIDKIDNEFFLESGSEMIDKLFLLRKLTDYIWDEETFMCMEEDYNEFNYVLRDETIELLLYPSCNVVHDLLQSLQERYSILHLSAILNDEFFDRHLLSILERSILEEEVKEDLKDRSSNK